MADLIDTLSGKVKPKGICIRNNSNLYLGPPLIIPFRNGIPKTSELSTLSNDFAEYLAERQGIIWGVEDNGVSFNPLYYLCPMPGRMPERNILNSQYVVMRDNQRIFVRRGKPSADVEPMKCYADSLRKRLR